MKAEQELIIVIWEEGSRAAAGGDPERQFGLQISPHSGCICTVVSLLENAHRMQFQCLLCFLTPLVTVKLSISRQICFHVFL